MSTFPSNDLIRIVSSLRESRTDPWSTCDRFRALLGAQVIEFILAKPVERGRGQESSTEADRNTLHWEFCSFSP